MSIEIRRGLKVDLPAAAPDGQPLFVEDTEELYMGVGASVVPVKIDSSNIIGTLSVAFSDIQSGTNTTAVMVIGPGASLEGVIDCGQWP